MRSIYDDRIVTFGVSCVGKTTFAKTLAEHHYYCFDSLFSWYDIETLGLPVTSGLKYISEIDHPRKFIIDGWVLADWQGKYFPKDVAIYVIYAPYDQIIRQYRVPVSDYNQHLPMFEKWYHEIDYKSLPSVRYLRNIGDDFLEQAEEDFSHFLASQNL